MTALADSPEPGAAYTPAAPARVDRAIRRSTAVAVLAVAGIAAYVSYWHAYAVVCAHGETGVTARLEPATIDGLVYASSMVNLYAARHRLPVPALARWLLALGIVATLAANMAQGWSHGPVGAVIAAWPAVSLVGSYELLVWIIRTATAADVVREPAADQPWAADQSQPDLRSVPDVSLNGPRADVGLVPVSKTGPQFLVRTIGPDQESGPALETVNHAHHRVQRSGIGSGMSDANGGEDEISRAAIAAYRASVESGKPLSERKLAGMFGRTSRRWARRCIAEARQSPVPA